MYVNCKPVTDNLTFWMRYETTVIHFYCYYILRLLQYFCVYYCCGHLKKNLMLYYNLVVVGHLIRFSLLSKS